LLELFSGEQRITGRGIVGEEVGAGLGAEGGEGVGVKVVKGVNRKGSGRNRRRQTGGSGGSKRETLGNLVEDRGGGRDANGLREHEPKVEREGRERKARIDGRRGDGGTKSEIGDASRTDGGVGGDIAEIGAPWRSRKPRATRFSSRKKADRTEAQQPAASRLAL
jgi:hypothetical protein